MKKFFRFIMLSINTLFILGILLSYVSGMINPASKIGVALYYFGLGYPVMLILNIGFVFFWMYRKRWYFLFSLIAIGIGYKTLHNTVPIHIAKKELAPPGTMKVFSYNVGGFAQTNNYLENANDILTYVNDEFPDVVCLQEIFLSYGRNYFDEEMMFSKLKKYPYKAVYYTSIKKYNRRGNVIFSKYPILRKGEYDVGDDSAEEVMFADINFNGKVVRIANAHLQSFKLKKIDKTLYDELSIKDQVELTSTMKQILKSLGKGAYARGKQVQKLKEYLDDCPFPVILTGDFNDTPGTYSYKRLSKGMNDAFVENSSGLGPTYNGNYPSFRIDYILYTPCIRSYGFERHGIEFSDHFPISTYVDLSKCK